MRILTLCLVVAILALTPSPAAADHRDIVGQEYRLVDASNASISASNPTTIATGADGYVYPENRSDGWPAAHGATWSFQPTIWSTASSFDVTAAAEVLLSDRVSHWSPATSPQSASASYTSSGAQDAAKLLVTIPGKRLRVKLHNGSDAVVSVEGGVIFQW